MHAFLFILSVINVKSICAASGEERKKILDLHNNEREKVNPPAADMQLMTYSTEMETLAAKWVEKCVFRHPDPRVDREYSGVGQNLAVFGGAKPADLYESSVSGWNREKANYVYSTNQCSGVCGHYTQVVWAKSNAVGCAWKSCPGIMSGYAEGYLVACQYKPQGNMNRMRPYVSGPSCSQCAKTDYCVKNQCSKYKDSGLRNNLAISSFYIFVIARLLN